MKVKIGYYSFFRQASGKSSEVIAIQDGTTLRTLITHLAAKYGTMFEKYALARKGELSPMMKISWNGRLLQKIAPEQILSEGDEVRLFPPIGGG